VTPLNAAETLAGSENDNETRRGDCQAQEGVAGL
jgi:hypothetical protein